MIIVSRKFQKKEVSNGMLGNSEGLLLVHPNILVDLVKAIRTMIVKMVKISKSVQDQDYKQEVLYQYVTSEKFCRSFANVLEVHTKLSFKLKKRKTTSHCGAIESN
jgi:nitrogenase subunit NifH